MQSARQSAPSLGLDARLSLCVVATESATATGAATGAAIASLACGAASATATKKPAKYKHFYAASAASVA